MTPEVTKSLGSPESSRVVITPYRDAVSARAESTTSDPDQVNARFADGCGQTITVAEGDGEASFDIVLDNPVAYNFDLNQSQGETCIYVG